MSKIFYTPTSTVSPQCAAAAPAPKPAPSSSKSATDPTDDPDTMPSTELQPVVLAGGRGSRMTQLSGERPKCLMPVGPYPVLWYSLHMLHRHGFKDVIVVVLDSQKNEIQSAIDKHPLKNMRLDFATIPADADYGTADALRHIKERLTADILVVAGDTITNASLFPLMDDFRQHNASLSALFIPNHSEQGVTVPGPKPAKTKPDVDLVGVDEETKRLHFLISTSDVDDQVLVVGKMLRLNQNLLFYSRMIDLHVYAIRRWVIEFLVPHKRYTTIKSEIVPWLIKEQLTRTGIQNDLDHTPFSEQKSRLTAQDVEDLVDDEEMARYIEKASIYAENDSRAPYGKHKIRCYATKAPVEAFGLRVNTTKALVAANAKIVEVWPELFSNSLDKKMRSTIPTQLVIENPNMRCTQLALCAIGDNVNIAERTSLKNSVVGANCVVRTKTRIIDSVVMNGCLVEEGCVIENCVLSDRVVVKAGCVLQNCIVGPSYTVEAGKKAENQYLSNAAGFMEI